MRRKSEVSTQGTSVILFNEPFTFTLILAVFGTSLTSLLN